MPPYSNNFPSSITFLQKGHFSLSVLEPEHSILSPRPHRTSSPAIVMDMMHFAGSFLDGLFFFETIFSLSFDKPFQITFVAPQFIVGAKRTIAILHFFAAIHAFFCHLYPPFFLCLVFTCIKTNVPTTIAPRAT